ncbi:MAG: hypothetical protein FWG60_02445 [Methanomassiliicoccaceae archaeon]|nr:hypothetical protein [Methanomassiliicoccaceae archaeon]
MDLEYDGLGSKVKILVQLLKEKEMKRSDFTKITNYDSAKKILERLQFAGLTESEAKGDYRDTVIWRLTEKGKKVAEMLVEVEKVIASDSNGL